MSAMPFYFCLAVIVLLGALLVLREMQNARMIKGLLDRILVKNDLAPLPDAPILEGGTGESQEDTDVKKKLEQALRQLDRQKQRERVLFRIPGMPVGMGDITAKGK